VPVRKFRTVEEMDGPIWHQPGHPALYRAMRIVWDFGRRANLRRFRPGVFRYRSIEDMRRAQEHWEAEHITALDRQRHSQ
jgi:hypothetical protein